MIGTMKVKIAVCIDMCEELAALVHPGGVPRVIEDACCIADVDVRTNPDVSVKSNVIMVGMPEIAGRAVTSGCLPPRRPLYAFVANPVGTISPAGAVTDALNV